MSIYYLIFFLFTSTILGLLGLSCILLSKKNLILKINSWYKKRVGSLYCAKTQKKRIEPYLKDIGLKQLKLISNDIQALLFDESTYDHKKFCILYLMAPLDQEYTGYVLWQALMSQKLKYGAMKIFHSYEAENATGKIIFSIANALEPGYFDVDHIDKIKTPGLCFFMQHHNLLTPLKSFEKMLKIAKRLEHLLGGTLCNHQRKPLSPSIIQTYYAQFHSLNRIDKPNV